MEQIGVKFKSGDMLVSLDPDSKKVTVTANINGTAFTGSSVLKPVKTTKEKK